MSTLKHPALTVFGQRREDITVDEWATIVARLSERIDTESQPSQRRVLVGMRMAALAAKDQAWAARERGLEELRSGK